MMPFAAEYCLPLSTSLEQQSSTACKPARHCGRCACRRRSPLTRFHQLSSLEGFWCRRATCNSSQLSWTLCAQTSVTIWWRPCGRACSQGSTSTRVGTVSWLLPSSALTQRFLKYLMWRSGRQCGWEVRRCAGCSFVATGSIRSTVKT
jgi:hypothetical protein